MTYFGTRLSENISRREPEGYLICLNVPVARTGTQDYLPSELGLPEPDVRLIPVHRPEEEVFSDACIASFEGMPVTDNHPSAPEGVTTENIRHLQKGHAMNIRRGVGADADLLLADLIITDPTLIQEVLDGKREISCGYTYTLHQEEGNYIQREIRGNHIAVVDAGRAGPRVSIHDHIFERSTLMKKKSLWRAKLMARMAKDGDVDGLAEIITEMMEEPAAPAAAALPAADPTTAGLPATDPLVAAVAAAVEENLEPASAAEEAPVVIETPVDQPVIVDCGPQILEALSQIIALLSGPVADCDPARTEDEETGTEAAEEATVEALAENVVEAAVEAVAESLAPEEDPLDALVAEILEADEDRAENPTEEDEEDILSHILEPEGDQDEEDPTRAAQAADALRASLAAFRPMLARMAPKDRQRFNTDVAARMKKLTAASAKGKPNPYAALKTAAAHDNDARSLGQKIMASRNANLRK
ncbi:MAG: DUF2213 domain-containing protein [Clostridia bacterium]|nr:DUF2213 domain-containing protein [Clostridia bacterium]